MHYVEKPSSEFCVQFDSEYDVLINGGIYMFSKDVILNLLEVAHIRKETEEVTGKGDNISLEMDILRWLPHQTYSFDVFKHQDYWYNLKTPLSALLANSAFSRNSNGWNDEADQLDLEYTNPYVTIGKNATIGRNVKIGNGVKIENAIIGDNVIIGDNSYVTNAIIDSSVVIGPWCRIEGSINNSTIWNDIKHSHSAGNIQNIHNLVVLCENTHVSEGVFVFNSIVLPHKELSCDIKYEIVM
ncbi:hypothetical protein CANTEDRAFT_109366 [Yamadazyma tenuis ATCC 10573]|nr:uncharacterized protein CANTEDRAFT_109366 [Yamadazyma tenuis ATCC 10573]EGV61449.1 hypothetical protein CANTEDRAFT_109366 [Yamadazyma tenuis ATCC 10573]